MSEYTYIPDTEHVYPNLTIKKVNLFSAPV